MQNLLPEPPSTLLPAQPDAEAALADAGSVDAAKSVAARYPAFSAAWATLSKAAAWLARAIPP